MRPVTLSVVIALIIAVQRKQTCSRTHPGIQLLSRDGVGTPIFRAGRNSAGVWSVRLGGLGGTIHRKTRVPNILHPFTVKGAGISSQLYTPGSLLLFFVNWAPVSPCYHAVFGTSCRPVQSLSYTTAMLLSFIPFYSFKPTVSHRGRRVSCDTVAVSWGRSHQPSPGSTTIMRNENEWF